MPPVQGAWPAVGDRSLDAVSLDVELLLPTAGAVGGTYASGIPERGQGNT